MTSFYVMSLVTFGLDTNEEKQLSQLPQMSNNTGVEKMNKIKYRLAL